MLIFLDRSFGELALLSSNMEIDMAEFGASAYKLAQNFNPSSIAARKYAYEFHAPESAGRPSRDRDASSRARNKHITFLIVSTRTHPHDY
jgi:hypothetical protein